MFESHHDVQLEPGSWSLWKTGKRALIFCCPTCRNPKIIRQDVVGTGDVVGEVVCIEPTCDFRKKVRLLDWPSTEAYP